MKTHRKKIWTKKTNQNRTDSASKSSDLRWFSSCMWIPATDLWLEQLDETFEPWITCFWVGFWKLGLGFIVAPAWEERRGKRRKRKNERSEQNRAGIFLYNAEPGRFGSDPFLPCSRPCDLDPDGSGSIQRFWCVLEIRIHQIRGFGLFTRRLWLFCQFLELVAMCTCMFAIWTSCAF